MKIVRDFKAFDVIQKQLDPSIPTKLVAGEQLYCELNGKIGNIYTIDSVVSCAMRAGRDPIEDIEQARENDHDLHFIYGSGTCITSSHRPKDRYTYVEIGMLVEFEGVTFTIEKAPNNNLKLC